MKYWAKDSGVKFVNSGTCFGQECAIPGAPLNIAVITIRGRYPEKGFIYNLEAHEMAYVVSGTGSVHVQDGQTQPLATGDIVYFGPMEKIAWDGDMLLVVPCSPAFDPNKHKETKL
jgi:hypothetical protein